MKPENKEKDGKEDDHKERDRLDPHVYGLAQKKKYPVDYEVIRQEEGCEAEAAF